MASPWTVRQDRLAALIFSGIFSYNFASYFCYYNFEKMIVNAGGGQTMYEVRSVTQVAPNEMAAMMKHQDLLWLTLVTCRGYDETSNSYKYRGPRESSAGRSEVTSKRPAIPRLLKSFSLFFA